jgi:hypothetical protein
MPRPWPFNHVATSRNNSQMTAVAPQPVSATVNRAGDSSLLPGRQRNPFKLDTTAHGLYKLSAPSAPLCNCAPNTPTRASNYSPEPRIAYFPKSVFCRRKKALTMASALQVRSCPLPSCFSTLTCPWCLSTRPIRLEPLRSPRKLHAVHCARCHRGQGDVELKSSN